MAPSGASVFTPLGEVFCAAVMVALNTRTTIAVATRMDPSPAAR
jgi:hypothetical protein